MALNQAAVVAKIRDLLATVTGVTAAHSAADTGEEQLPMGLAASGVGVMVWPGGTAPGGYILTNGGHRHTYEVIVQVLQAGPEPGARAAAVSVMPDRIIEKLVGNVALGGVCNSCRFLGCSRLQVFDFGGTEFTGYEITLEVSEQAAASPQFGS